MKKHPHLDAAIVAALLLAYVPNLADNILPEAIPAALMLPAAETPDTPDNPAERL